MELLMAKKKDLGMLTIRQYFYQNNVFDKEYFIKALERTYSSQKKKFEEWEEICAAKKINF